MKKSFQQYKNNRTQWTHILTLPIFFIAFMLLYRPEWAISQLSTAKKDFDFVITISTCIIFGTILFSRGMFFIGRDKVTVRGYCIWCFAEIIATSLFIGLFLWLIHDRTCNYYTEVGFSILLLVSVLIFPYIMIALASICLEEVQLKDDTDKGMIKFKDSYNVHKLSIAATSLIYAASDENYVTIFYKKGDNAVKYVLRSSMKRVEEECKDFINFYRCHRSFIINTSYVKVIGKENDGTLFVELKEPDGTRIPISRKYYDDLLTRL